MAKIRLVIFVGDAETRQVTGECRIEADSAVDAVLEMSRRDEGDRNIYQVIIINAYIQNFRKRVWEAYRDSLYASGASIEEICLGFLRQLAAHGMANLEET